MTKLLSAVLIAACASTGLAQQATTQTAAADRIRQHVEALAPQAHISVQPLHGPEEFGNFIAHDEQSLTFYDIDRKADVTLPYTGVRTIKDGYGGYNSAQHRHTDHSRGVIIAVVVLGGLAALVAAAAAAH